MSMNKKVIIAVVVFITIILIACFAEIYSLLFQYPETVAPGFNFKQPSDYKIKKIYPKVRESIISDRIKVKLTRIEDINSDCCGDTAFLTDKGNVLLGCNNLKLFDSKQNKFIKLSNLYSKAFGWFITKYKNNKYLIENKYIYDEETSRLLYLSNKEGLFRTKRINQLMKNLPEEGTKVPKYDDYGFLSPELRLYATGCYWYRPNEGGVAYTSNCDGFYILDFLNLKISKNIKFKVKRAYFESLKLKNGKILFIGGMQKINPEKTSILRSIELYDPKTEDISFICNMRIPRYKSKSVELPDGKILITGGISSGNNNAIDCKQNGEILNLKTGKTILTENSFNICDSFGYFSNKDQIKYNMAYAGKEIVVISGLITYLYDMKTNKFYSLGNLAIPRIKSNLIIKLKENKMLLVGNPIMGPTLTNFPYCEVAYLKYKAQKPQKLCTEFEKTAEIIEINVKAP